MTTRASDALLRMIGFDGRARMVADQQRRYAVGLMTRDDYEALVRDVVRIDVETINSAAKG